MEEKFKEIYEKATDIFFSLTKKFDGVSEKIYEQTGTKINIGVIVLLGIIAIFIAFIVKMILGFVWSFLWT